MRRDHCYPLLLHHSLYCVSSKKKIQDRFLQVRSYSSKTDGCENCFNIRFEQILPIAHSLKFCAYLTLIVWLASVQTERERDRERGKEECAIDKALLKKYDTSKHY